MNTKLTVPSLEDIYIDINDIDNAEVVATIENLGIVSPIDSEELRENEIFRKLPLSEQRKLIKQKYMEVEAVEENNEWKIPKVITNGAETHLYFFETAVFNDNYVRNIFMYLSMVPENTILKIFFYKEFEMPMAMLSEFIPIFNAIRDTKARTVAKCYAALTPMATLVALACDELDIGEYGSMSFEYPDIDSWGQWRVYQEYVDFLFTKCIERGVLTSEEYEELKENNNKTLVLYSADLKTRIAS